ncbi:hypothetical protein EU527_05775 [Candidatus Thorarchaeota archaeon]|nr:MAG: hypothetical protein EU527_05775 [Candidatus Thorarchaeota archaeon]
MVLWLQAMYHSGEVSSYISAKVPNDKLSTGWIGQSILQKGFTGKLQDKKNQEQLVIPLDRFVRLTKEWTDQAEPILGMCLIGTRGLTEKRFIALVSSSSEDQFNSSIAIAFQSEKSDLKETIDKVTHFVTDTRKKKKITEPNLDYIEQLKSDVSDGSVNHLLSIRLSASEDKTSELIQNMMKTDVDSNGIVAQYGKKSIISPLILLFSRWLLGLDLFRKTRDTVATILFLLPSEIQLCLWDTPQRLATFTCINNTDLSQVFENYIIPLWFSSDNLTASKSKSPMVVIETEKKIRPSSIHLTPDTESLDVASYPPSADILKHLAERIDLLEARLKDFSTPNTESTRMNTTTLDIVQSRLTETIDKMESLVIKLSVLEKRIDKVNKKVG